MSSSAVAHTLAEALHGRYEIERELGRGGMATVLLARDLKHDRLVALKVLHPNLAEALGPERFVREIRLAARLQHPHILTVFDSGDSTPDGGGAPVLWYTMPYVDGLTLRDRLLQEPTLPVEDAVKVTRQVAEALDYAHRNGVVHRDIKPENILLSGYPSAGPVTGAGWHALITDFGVARPLAQSDAGGSGERSLTQTGMAVGTPAYMSPEQGSGDRALDGRSDIYALGCVLYEMLAGAPPFQGPTPQATFARRLTAPAPSVRAARPAVPQSLAQALARALAREPDERFPTAGRFAEALASTSPGEGWRGSVGEKSIAVLPFANLSPDPDNEFFSDGMTDELINALAKLPGVHVVSRTSTFAFKGKQLDVRSIGAQLGVQTVLEGSVRRAGRRLRLAVQLINVADGYQLWSETFDREMEDVFAIQDEISRGIVSRLKVRLLGAGAETLVKPATADFEAYTLYLKGRQLWNRRTEQSLRQGLQAFEAALARDPGYALAWAGVADSYVILGFYSALPPREAFPRAKAAALRALELDPGLADAHPALAYVRMYHDWDWAAAEQAFHTAIELNPSHATAHQWYGNFLAIVGRFEECEHEFRWAVALDPLSPLRSAALGWGYYFARRYEDAAAQCRLALELDPESVVAHHWLGLVLEQMEQPATAVAELRDAVRLSNRAVAPLGSLGHTLAIGGAGEEARAILAELTGRAREHYVPSYDVALIHLGLGDRPAALDALTRACEERSHQMAFIKVDPRLDPLRGEARFVRLLEEVGLAG